MTRQEKLNQFFTVYGSRWCTAEVCGCMGCVNHSQRSIWLNMFPGEEPIKKEEAMAFPKPEQKPIDLKFSFYRKNIPKDQSPDTAPSPTAE